MISRTLLGRVGVPRKPNTPTRLSSSLSQYSTAPARDTAALARLNHKDWLTPQEATTLLSSLTDPSSTLTFFHLYTSRKDFHPSEPLCKTLISKLAEAKHLIPILTLHETLPKRRRFSDDFFFALVKAYAHSFQRLDMALETLRNMPFPPSTRTFNFLLNALVDARLHDAARGLFLGAPRLGVAIDACSLNIVIKGLCSRGETDAALGVLGEFRVLGCEANARTYSTLMKGLCDAGRVEEAFGLLERMEDLGVDVDAAVYNVLIGGLRKVGRVDEGWRVLEMMVGRGGVIPNGGSYNEVLCGLVEEGRVEEGKGIVERMGVKGFVPSFGAYKGLLKGFCDKGLVGEVEWVVWDMVRKGFVPRMGMWRRIVKCVVERERSDGWVGGAIDGVLEE